MVMVFPWLWGAVGMVAHHDGEAEERYFFRIVQQIKVAIARHTYLCVIGPIIVFQKRCGMSLKVLLGVVVCLGAGSAWSQASPATVTLCQEDVEAYPWTMVNKLGYSAIMMGEVEKQGGLTIKLVSKPWAKCLEEVKAGTMDGAINASYSKERAEFATYPLKIDGDIDASKRMYRTSYALYKFRGNSLDFDGSALKGLSGSIGVQTGFSVAAQLKQLGAQVDEGFKSADDILKSVVSGKFQGAALQVSEADASLAALPQVVAKIERVSKPLAEKPYFTIFSKTYANKSASVVREIWRIQAKVRESAEFKAKVSHLVKTVE